MVMVVTGSSAMARATYEIDGYTIHVRNPNETRVVIVSRVAQDEQELDISFHTLLKIVRQLRKDHWSSQP